MWSGCPVFPVYCKKCKTNVFDICKVSGKSIKLCPNADKHVYKMYVSVPGTKNERRTKILDTRDLDEAIIQAIAFKQEVKGNKINTPVATEIKNEKKPEEQNIPRLLIHVMARYIGWLNNENVRSYRVRVRSNEHIKDIERAFRVLAECLKNNGYNLSTVTIDDINDEMIDDVCTYLKSKQFANRTFNKYINYYSSLLKWYSKAYNLNTKNWFEDIERKRLNPKPEAITKNEYEALLKQITPENGIRECNGVKPIRNMYRTWLVDAIKLGLETGRRREEVIKMKFSDIKEDEGFKYIDIEDFKVNRIQNRIEDGDKKSNYVPVTASLEKLLDELGYDKRNNTDAYILAPDIKTSRGKVMSNIVTRGFTHYYDQLNTGRKLTFKCLRKTYITNLQIYFSRTASIKDITGHSGNQVIEGNYLAKKEIVKALVSFSVFSKEFERTGELNEIRKEAKNKLQTIEKEVSYETI